MNVYANKYGLNIDGLSMPDYRCDGVNVIIFMIKISFVFNLFM